MKRGAVRQWKDPSRLTPQEVQIWELYQQGKKAPEIADALGLAKKGSTIASAIRRIKEKLGINQKESADVY